MAAKKKNYGDVEQQAPGMHFLRDAPNCERLGLTLVEGAEEWSGMEHDHAEEDHAEVYLLMEGSGTLTVDGEDVDLDPGDAVRVSPSWTRTYEFDVGSRMVVGGAP